MKLSLPFKGQNVDISSLTAAPSDVRKGKKYIGSGGDDERIGEMERIAPVTHSLPLNGVYNIPAGEHTGQDVIRQELPTMGTQYVAPGAGQIVIECAGKYMTGNIVIQAVANLTAENIKYGVTVGEGEGAVTGTCQGFFD